jgi:hypothetical protein
MPVVLLSASALVLGFLHGLGVDHLMAIAALSIDGRTQIRQRHIIRTALQFAFGHTIMLGAGVFAALTFGWILPAAFASGAERVGGGLLVLLGIAGFVSTFSGQAYGHVHTEGDGQSRWHVHFGAKATHPRGAHAHSILPTAMGAAFAVSSLRALVMLAPLGSSLQSMAVPTVLLLVLLFGLGILLSMSLFGVILARALSLRRLELLGRAAGFIVAAASVALGAYWMWIS